MKITRFLLVFLIFSAVLLAGCTDKKTGSSDSAAALPSPDPAAASPIPQDASDSIPGSENASFPPAISESESGLPPAQSGDSETPEPVETAPHSVEPETNPVIPTVATESTQIPNESTVPAATEDGGMQVEEDPTQQVSGAVEIVGGE